MLKERRKGFGGHENQCPETTITGCVVQGVIDSTQVQICAFLDLQREPEVAKLAAGRAQTLPET